MGKVHWIEPSGEITTEEHDAPPSYEEMKEFVDGWVEIVSVLFEGHCPTQMIINEEGRIKDLPRNQVATDIYLANLRSQYPDAADDEACHRLALAAAREKYRMRGINMVEVDLYPGLPFIAGHAIVLEGLNLD